MLGLTPTTRVDRLVKEKTMRDYLGRKTMKQMRTKTKMRRRKLLGAFSQKKFETLKPLLRRKLQKSALYKTC